LAALIVAPMFFNVFSSRVFEPDKISLLRSIALIMLLAWLVKVVNSGQLWLPAYTGGNGADKDETEGAAVEGADAPNNAPSLWSRLWHIPFLLPILLLIVAYLISTTFSVARFVSWWGSYQRLQGTYTFLSYILIALLAAAHLRTPTQIRRLQHTIILTSLPIAIYGVIQHYAIDPLPWGGDVTRRIAANAGNAIFLAAYLLMALFFTVERIYSSFAHLLTDPADDGDDAAAAGDDRQDMPTALAGGVYLFIFMVQCIAIFWTQSRGPFLGVLLGFYIFGLLLFSGLRPRGYRVWTLSWIGVGLAGAVFLVLLNTTAVSNVVRSVPSLARLSTLLDLESTTAQVRVLIWQGAEDMLTPHEPLTYPDGSDDAVNAIRPLIGYGPEAMWVAYNPFYPPDLAHYERRNASPDRSHNETWDALVITGIVGFIAYMALFISIFYWALRWLGLITGRRDSILFGALLAIFSLAWIIIFYFVGNGWHFFGVALPAGMMMGLGLYITVAVFLHPDFKPSREDIPRQLLIIALIATFAAHFVEIHFGIAIAATRTYFWVQTALLLVLGMRWAQAPAFAISDIVGTGVETANGETVAQNRTSSKKRRKRTGRQSRNRGSTRGLPALPATVMSDLLIFFTFVFIYTTNSRGADNAFAILFNSILKRPEGGELVNSPAIFFLMLFTWLIGATLGLTAASLSQRRAPDLGWWLRGYGLPAAVVWGGWLLYGLIQAGRLAPGAAGTTLDSQLDHVADHFALYTWIVVFWMLAAGAVYAWPWLRDRHIRTANRLAVSAGTAAALAVVFFLIIGNVNIALVRADIIYKQGQQFDSQRNWINSIELYRRALRARTTEDHYMLFLGRALLEQAKQAEPGGGIGQGADPTFEEVLALSPQEIGQMSRTELLRAAEAILLRAQEVNPLNTDHTANLARLYRSWADLSDDAEVRQEMLDQSIAQYNTAVQLSRNAAHLWNEKGNAHLARGEPELAEEAYLHSLSLDQLFQQTYLLLADFYNRREEYERTMEILEQGIADMEASPRVRPTAQMYSYLGVARHRAGDLQGAIDANLEIVERQPNNQAAMRNLAILYRDAGQPEEAVEWTQRTLAGTAEDNTQQIAQLHQLLIELHQMLIAQNPDNYHYPLELAQLLLEVGQPDNARQYAEQALALAPEDQKPTINELLQSIGTGS